MKEWSRCYSGLWQSPQAYYLSIPCPQSWEKTKINKIQYRAEFRLCDSPSPAVVTEPSAGEGEGGHGGQWFCSSNWGLAFVSCSSLETLGLLSPQVVISSLYLAILVQRNGAFISTLVLPSVKQGEWILTATFAFFFQQDEKHFDISLLLPFLFLCKLTTWESVQLKLVSLASDHTDGNNNVFLLLIPLPAPFSLAQNCTRAHHEARHSASGYTTELLKEINVKLP